MKYLLIVCKKSEQYPYSLRRTSRFLLYFQRDGWVSAQIRSSEARRTLSSGAWALGLGAQRCSGGTGRQTGRGAVLRPETIFILTQTQREWESVIAHHWPLVDQSITAHNSTDLKLNSTYHLFKTNYIKYKLGKYIKLCSNVILVWLILNNKLYYYSFLFI